eukprot:g4494.t1
MAATVYGISRLRYIEIALGITTTMRNTGEKQITYVLTRILFIRSIAFIYFVAFLVAYNQNPGLLGDDGLLSSQEYFNRLKQHVGVNTPPQKSVMQIPTLLWFLDDQQVFNNIQQFALAGLTISALVFYHVPRVAIYANWWLIFRIMIGSGLIKIRGDECWRDLTCMDYHYETQPVPNPLSFYLHHNFSSFHKVETMVNHIVELITPWFMFLSRDLRIMNGMFQIIFQLILISSGNLSFLNWLTILPSLCFLDDQFLTKWFPMFYNTEMRKKYDDHDATSTSSTASSSLVEGLSGKEAKDVYDLIQFDPFYNQTKPPKFIKADHYEYKFAPWNHKDKKAWWVRKYLKEYFPPLSLDNKSLKKFLGKS